MPKIPIYVSNEKAYVWAVQDVSDLRTKHRICGTLSGTLPHLTQQNFFLGLPLLLMPEEVVLLVENGVAMIVNDNTAFQPPSAEDLSTWDKARRDEFDRQISAWYDRENIRQNLQGKKGMSDVAMQKRREREERRKKSLNSFLNTFPPSQDTNASTPSVNDSSDTRMATYNIHIPATSLSHPWYLPNTHEDLESAKDAGVWQYPSTPWERASCRVFRDLWDRGYFLGSGLKFGGDFLVYPGDPLRYHSHFVASVIESPSTAIRPMEIIAHGRLGTATKKAHLLCGWDEKTQQVTYFSIEWAGFG